MKQINDAKEKLSAENTRLSARHDTVCTESDKIIAQLFESYELTRSEAMQIAEKIDDMITAQKELTEVRNKIRALGSVNVDADRGVRGSCGALPLYVRADSRCAEVKDGT